MILILGGDGFIASAFRKLFDQEGVPYRTLSRKSCDYTSRDRLISEIIESKASFLINAAGYAGKPNVDACEIHKAECLDGNAVLPGVVRAACEHADLPWGHVSSGCIYTGSRPDGGGYTESDPPNFCFRTDNCSFYSGCKALGEECLQNADQAYVWRLRIPFNEVDSQRNYLSKLMRYERLLDATNSITQLDEFTRACWQTWAKRVPFGIYNVTNPGRVTTREIVGMIQENALIEKEFRFFDSEAEFMELAATAPRSNCVLDSTKLRQAGLEMSPVYDAIQLALQHWSPADASI